VELFLRVGCLAPVLLDDGRIYLVLLLLVTVLRKLVTSPHGSMFCQTRRILMKPHACSTALESGTAA